MTRETLDTLARQAADFAEVKRQLRTEKNPDARYAMEQHADNVGPELAAALLDSADQLLALARLGLALEEMRQEIGQAIHSDDRNGKIPYTHCQDVLEKVAALLPDAAREE